jgi:hypothetical protein
MFAAIMAGVEISLYRDVTKKCTTICGEPHFRSEELVTVGKDKFYNARLQGGSGCFHDIL